MDRVSARFARTVSGELQEVAEGVYLLPGFGNCTLILGDEGAAVVDPGLFQNGPRVVSALRGLSDAPVRYVIYTHGHYDHAFGTPALLEDAAARGHAPPAIVGHVNVARRFDALPQDRRPPGRDVQPASSRAGPAPVCWEAGTAETWCARRAIVPPTLEYEDRIALALGELTLHCRHGKGETDDHTWLWIPEREYHRGRRLHRLVHPERGHPLCSVHLTAASNRTPARVSRPGGSRGSGPRTRRR